jgi:hypothetical protein
LVHLKTKSAGDGYPKKAIKKTVLRFLGSGTFSHGLVGSLPFEESISERKGASTMEIYPADIPNLATVSTALVKTSWKSAA